MNKKINLNKGFYSYGGGRYGERDYQMVIHSVKKPHIVHVLVPGEGLFLETKHKIPIEAQNILA